MPYFEYAIYHIHCSQVYLLLFRLAINSIYIICCLNDICCQTSRHTLFLICHSPRVFLFYHIKTFSDKILNGTTTSQHGPHFGPAGLATYLNSSGNFVIDGDGNIVLQDWSADYGKHELSEFGQFQKSGYAKIKQVKIDYNRYLGLMDTKGQIVWLFGTGDTPDCSILPIEPIEPDEPGQPGHPLPPYPQPIDPETPPVGPKVPTEHTYSIKVQKE